MRPVKRISFWHTRPNSEIKVPMSLCVTLYKGGATVLLWRMVVRYAVCPIQDDT
jgi:hypothetical protein